MGQPRSIVNGYLSRFVTPSGWSSMRNPYSLPKTSSAGPRLPRPQTRGVVLVCVAVGAFAAILVYAGDALRWPHFNRRAGYIGTEFISGLLYAINDPYAIHIVALLWFSYAALVTGVLVYACRKLWSVSRRLR
jgi:hypothetical protein